MEISLTRLLNMGESGLEYVKSFDMPLGRVKKSCQIGSYFSSTSELSQNFLNKIHWASGPPDIAALVLDALDLVRSLKAPEIESAIVGEIALSILEKSCDVFEWLHTYSFITLESTVLWRLEGIGILSDLAASSIRLWQDLGPTPLPDRDLIISISKVFKTSLLLYAYVTDDKRVKLITMGIGLMGDGYSLYKHRRTFDPSTWTVTQAEVCQVITSIALAGLAYYVIEKCFITEVVS
jgi:hypothetical protein